MIANWIEVVEPVDMEEPYPLPAPRPAPRTRSPRGVGCFSWSLTAVLLIITGYSGMAAYRLKDDAATAAALTTSFWIFLVLLLCCLLSLNERAAAGSSESRKRLSWAFVWALATLLFFHVAYMAMGAAALTLRAALLLWFLPAAAWAGICVCAFFHQDRVNQPPDETMLPPV